MKESLVLVGLDDSGRVALQNKCGTAVDAWIATQLSKKVAHFEGAPEDEITSGDVSKSRRAGYDLGSGFVSVHYVSGDAQCKLTCTTTAPMQWRGQQGSPPLTVAS